MTELAVSMEDYPEPTAEDIAAARDAAREFAKFSPAATVVKFRLASNGDTPAGEPISIPAAIFKTIIDLLVKVGNGNAVQLVPVQAELTTQQAADLLNVSRPHLVKLLERGEIKFRMVGTHRKVRARELLSYRDRMAEARRGALGRMVAADEEMGLYDDEPIKARDA